MIFDWAALGLRVIAASSHLTIHVQSQGYLLNDGNKQAVNIMLQQKDFRNKWEVSLSTVEIFEFFLVSYLTRSEEISFVITFNFLTVSAITWERKALNSWSQCSDIKKIYIRLSNFRNFHKLMP